MRRHRLPAAVLLAAISLTGCSSGAIDVPDAATVPAGDPAQSAQAAEPSATPIAEPEQTAAAPEIDCAEVLPPSTLESDLELPEGFVTLSGGSGSGTCAYTMAGNTGAVQIAWTATPDSAAEAAARWALNGLVTPAELGDAAAIQAADTESDRPTAFAALAGGIEVTIVSYVSTQEQIESYAGTFFDALGVTVG